MGGMTEEPRRRLDELGPLDELWAPQWQGLRSLDAITALASTRS